MGLRAMLSNHIPACRSELKLSIMKSFSIVETVKEASAVCRSFLDGVIIFPTKRKYETNLNKGSDLLIGNPKEAEDEKRHKTA